MIADKYVVNVEGVIFRDGRYLLIVRGTEEDHAPGGMAPPGDYGDGIRRLQAPVTPLSRVPSPRRNA